MVAATACSATTVLPDPVGALTSTERPASMAAMASSWKRSRVKPRASASLTATRLGPGLLAAPQLGQQGADPDGDAVEQDHGDGQRGHGDGIAARGDDGGDDHD